MRDITGEIQSLATFRGQSGDVMKQLKKTRRPVALTVKGNAAAVRLLDITASANAEEGIRQGIEDVTRGKVRPAREFFEDFEAEHSLPR